MDQDCSNTGFLWLATRPSVVQRATKIALIVGTVLAFINHGDRLLTLSISFGDLIKIVLTYFVPYSVSTYSSVQALRERLQVLRDDA